MTKEEILKEEIVKKYGNLHNFCLEADIPYSTMTNLFKRGLGGTSVDLYLKICRFLGINADKFGSEGIVEKRILDIHEVTRFDLELLTAYHDKTELQEAVNILLGVSPTLPSLPNLTSPNDK